MKYDELFKEIYELKKRTRQIYIYGYGSYGRNLGKILQKNNICFEGYVITSKAGAEDCDNVFSIYELNGVLESGFILGLNVKNGLEALETLKSMNISSNNILDARKYIEASGQRRGMRNGSIEITTVIGCKVNCKYCPQALLLNNYYEKSELKEKKMSIETFERCLEFFPKEYDISFGGMSEPFLNDLCTDMLRIACEKGRKVSLYTTLVGLDESCAKEVLSLPIEWVTIHVADCKKYAHIPTTENYYKVLEMFVNSQKENGASFVNMCNAQTKPDKRAAEICKNKFEIFSEMTDRAGNLEEEGLIRSRFISGGIVCGNSSNGELNNNILLPDGSVVLCCMDYGLEHILGNIYKNSFEEIMAGEEMKRIMNGMVSNDENILCRKCSYARPVCEM